MVIVLCKGQLKVGNGFYQKNVEQHNGTNWKFLSGFIKIDFNTIESNSNETVLTETWLIPEAQSVLL